MSAGGMADVPVDRFQGPVVLPEILAQFRRRIDEAVMHELLTIQAAAAMEAGLVSPAPLVVDTFPSAQGSQRGNDAATLYKAQKKSSTSSRRWLTSWLRGQQPCRPKWAASSTTSSGLCAAAADRVEGRAKCV